MMRFRVVSSGGWPGARPALTALRQGTPAATAVAARSLQQVTSLLLTLLAARFLVPAEYGVYTLSVVFVLFFQTLIYSGVYNYVIASTEEERPLLDTTFWLLIGAATLGFSLLAGTAHLIAGFYDAPELRRVLTLLAAAQPPAAAVAWISAVLMRQKRLQLHYNIMIVQNVAAFAGGAFLLFTWQSVYALVAFRYLRIAIGALLYFGWARLWPSFRTEGAIVRKAISFSSGLYGARSLSFLANYGADLVLGALFSTAEAGLYRFGNRLATAAIDVVRQPILSFATAQFAAETRDRRPTALMLRNFVSTSVFFVGAVAVTVAAFGEIAIEVLFRPEYLGALAVTYALAGRALFGLGDMFVEPVLAAHGRTGKVLVHRMIFTAASLVAIVAFAPLGLAALAWSQAGVALAASVRGTAVLANVSGAQARTIAAAAGKALGIVGVYAAAVWLAVTGSQTAFLLGPAALGLSAVLAGSLGIAALGVALRLRVVRLTIFSG